MTDEPSPYFEVVERNWKRALPYIEAALVHAHGSHTPDDILAGISAGKLQLWIGERCAAVSEIQNYPRKRALNMFLAGGDLEELKSLTPGIEAFARAQACSSVQATARLTKGAKAKLRDWLAWLLTWPDYDPGHLLCIKELR